jgi:hypothetical protein
MARRLGRTVQMLRRHGPVSPCSVLVAPDAPFALPAGPGARSGRPGPGYWQLPSASGPARRGAATATTGSPECY